MRCLAWWILVIFCGCGAFAQQPFAIDPAHEQTDFMPYDLTILIDTTNTLSFEQITSPSYAHRFRSNRSYQNKDFRRNASYWIKLPIRHNPSTGKIWLLEFYDQTIDYV